MQRRLRWLDVMQDVRVSVAEPASRAVLTLTILLTVGLGIGATTAIFGAVDAAFLRPLPYADPDVWCGSTPMRRRSSSVLGRRLPCARVTADALRTHCGLHRIER